MYLPRHFEVTDPKPLHALIRDHPLGTWVSGGGVQGYTADHVPFLLDVPERAGQPVTLLAHVARGNPVWRAAAGQAALIVFQGASHHVSPSWYPGKAAHGKVVPTWNYAVVHAHGRVVVHDDPAWLRRLLPRLTSMHEGAVGSDWQMDDAPADYIDAMLRAIVGIEITVERLVGKWKVSQNRDAADREGVARGLAALPSEEAARMAALVRAGGPDSPADAQ